ncbi:MAG TPA: BamA/TamA family outer membrane protein [Gemmatimonadales bacterium]|nr:BamA/TamA family outer membrane protein [Gemmatimonadales bacterium]
MALACGSAHAQAPGRAPGPAQAATDTMQRDAMDVLAHLLGRKPGPPTKAMPERKVLLTVLPAFSANPSVGLLLGVSGTAVTRLGPPPATNLTVLSASINFTTKNQMNLLLRSNVFLPRNRLKLEGDWRYLDTNQPTYGLGPAQPSSAEANMDFRLLRLYETVFFAVGPQTLIGPGYHLDYHFDIVDRRAQSGPTPFLEYNGGQTVTSTTASGLSFNALHDSRDNPINPTAGILVSASFRIFPKALGSDQTWQSLQGEVRVYPRLPGQRRRILAFWGLAWLTFGTAPYLDLPAIGWDYANRSGRGYAQGRIRGTDMLYAEAEYRVTLSRNGLWGAAAFLNLTSASAPGARTLPSPDLGGGIGLRVKLNKHSDTNITIDFAAGAQGSGGIFLGTGEAF